MSEQAQVQQTQQHIKVEVRVTVRHMFDEGVYTRTAIIIEACGEATVDNRNIKFECKTMQREFDMTRDMSDFMRQILEEVEYQKKRAIEAIENFIENKKMLVAELSKLGEVVEEYAPAYEPDDDDEDEW